MNQKSEQGFIAFASSRSYFFEEDSEQLHVCEPDSMKSTIIAMNEQSHKGPRGEDDHCVLYMTESEANDYSGSRKRLSSDYIY